ncbi:hypothetical protein [Nostoc sp. UHCC 0251]|uniref:hypothetical protein n=1 Tax=Nostoc sp. UHCC 0251 TaxID=3110240 RepID=UPI002B212624|nr:hypothetical protein [Nostoc sp. UHCC 0251]MEA5628377.1 hypothetical protein [Nostoc sp. UHCC 0251]
MKIEIQGQDALQATEELLKIEGLSGSYETVKEKEKEAFTLATIISIVGMTSGILNIAEKLFQWKEKYQKSKQDTNGAKIEKVLIVTADGRRLLLKDTTTLEQIQAILEKSK